MTSNIGLGTAAPTTQLHTTGGVRFQVLTGLGNRLTQTDATGVLSPVTAGTLGQVLTQTATGLTWAMPPSTNNWSLTGNTLTTGQWLGSINKQAVAFKVNNTEAMRISEGGGVSVGTTAGGIENTVENFSNFAAGWKNRVLNSDGSVALGAENTINNTIPIGKSIAIGWFNNISQSNGYAIGTNNVVSQEYAGVFGINGHANASRAFVIGAGAGGSNRLVNSISNSLMIGFSTKSTLFVRDASIGINTTTPSANLHSVGTVRLEGLEMGKGNILVIDEKGNVYRSSVASLLGTNTTRLEKQESIIKTQKEQIEDLQKQINDVKQILKASNSTTFGTLNDEAKLEQNIPNPTNGKTTINYTIPTTIKRASLMISDLSGKQLQSFNLNTHQTSIDVEMKDAGLFIYTLILDGKIANSKKMLVENKL